MHRRDGAPERKARSRDKSKISGYNYFKGIVLKSTLFFNCNEINLISNQYILFIYYINILSNPPPLDYLHGFHTQ